MVDKVRKKDLAIQKLRKVYPSTEHTLRLHLIASPNLAISSLSCFASTNFSAITTG